jgi:hypothetical protein
LKNASKDRATIDTASFGGQNMSEEIENQINSVQIHRNGSNQGTKMSEMRPGRYISPSKAQTLKNNRNHGSDSDINSEDKDKYFYVPIDDNFGSKVTPNFKR